MRLFKLSARYSTGSSSPKGVQQLFPDCLQLGESAKPVGPMTSAAGSLRSANPVPTIVTDSRTGICFSETARFKRTTVLWFTIPPLAATRSEERRVGKEWRYRGVGEQ